MLRKLELHQNWVHPKRHVTLFNTDLMLGQRRRRWTNIKPVLDQRHVSAVDAEQDLLTMYACEIFLPSSLK